jgi:hypothetical protein
LAVGANAAAHPLLSHLADAVLSFYGEAGRNFDGPALFAVVMIHSAGISQLQAQRAVVGPGVHACFFEFLTHGGIRCEPAALGLERHAPAHKPGLARLYGDLADFGFELQPLEIARRHLAFQHNIVGS